MTRRNGPLPETWHTVGDYIALGPVKRKRPTQRKLLLTAWPKRHGQPERWTVEESRATKDQFTETHIVSRTASGFLCSCNTHRPVDPCQHVEAVTDQHPEAA